MKVKIELDPSMDEPEILIRAPRLTPELTQLQERILEQKVAPLAFYKDRSEYFLDVASILFFETDGEKIFGHTKEQPFVRGFSLAAGSTPGSSAELESRSQVHPLMDPIRF